MARRGKKDEGDFLYRTVVAPMPPLSDEDFERLIRLRLDAGHLWASLVVYHRMIRRDRRKWPSMLDLAKDMTGQTAELDLALPTQSQNYLFDEFLGVVRTAAENRKTGAAAGGAEKARYPWRQRKARDCHWDRSKDARNVKGGFTLAMAMGLRDDGKPGLKRRKPLFIPYRPGIPKNCASVTIHYSIDDRRFYILFKIKERAARDVFIGPRPVKVMGVDLGQLRAAASVTEDGESQNIKGRGLRMVQQGHQKKKAFRRSRIDKKKKGSNNRRKEGKKLARESRRARNQVSNFLHTTSRRIVDFAAHRGVTHVFVGDPTGVRDHDVGRRQNQANHDWANARLFLLVEYKGERLGIKAEDIDERGTTRTCPMPGCGHKRKPRGRVYECSSCGLVAHRDAVGAWNILVRGYASIRGGAPEFSPKYVAIDGQKYLTPVAVKGVRRKPAPRNPYAVVSSAEQPRSEGEGQPNHVTRGRAPDDGMEQAGSAGSSRTQKADDESAA